MRTATRSASSPTRRAAGALRQRSDRAEGSRRATTTRRSWWTRPAPSRPSTGRSTSCPFGEYVPHEAPAVLRRAAGSVRLGFLARARDAAMPVAGRQVSTAICYEVVYPGLARQAVQGGSQLLTTITNDAWYGRSSAPWQHFEQASLRAIEQGRYLARAANTGISGIVDPYGRIVARSQLFEQTTLVGDARFLTDRTIYSRIGDVFAYACAVLAAGAILMGRRNGGTSGPASPDPRSARGDGAWHSRSKNSSDATRISPNGHPSSGAIFDRAAPREELTRLEGLIATARFLEQPGRSPEDAAAPPPPRGGSRDGGRAEEARGRPVGAGRVGRAGRGRSSAICATASKR